LQLDNQLILQSKSMDTFKIVKSQVMFFKYQHKFYFYNTLNQIKFLSKLFAMKTFDRCVQNVSWVGAIEMNLKQMSFII
jgi:hypothetical protein